ncbi:MAG: YqeG family HAD IIIA-type phosphatase [Armatimonadota bacterium]|nr:YqeG family HAD IIIA-type phosphatase [Armatimonadota bacterium]
MITRLFCPSAFASSLSGIDLDDLRARGIDFLILDLDNTLAEWQRYEIPDATAAWVKSAQDRGMKLCIASNTRNSRRLESIAGRLGVYSICRALKPRMRGFALAMELMGAVRARTAVIGDQILTDIFGGNRAGLYTILVPPMHPREFIGTKLSRIVERLLLFWFRRKGLMGTKPKPPQSERKERA